MHKTSGETVAVKIVDLNKNKDAAACVYKEVKIHKLLDHPNIIKLYGNRRENEPATEYIYLEYASGGELFNKIGKSLYIILNVNLMDCYFKNLTLECHFMRLRSTCDNYYLVWAIYIKTE